MARKKRRTKEQIVYDQAVENAKKLVAAGKMRESDMASYVRGYCRLKDFGGLKK